MTACRSGSARAPGLADTLYSPFWTWPCFISFYQRAPYGVDLDRVAPEVSTSGIRDGDPVGNPRRRPYRGLGQPSAGVRAARFKLVYTHTPPVRQQPLNFCLCLLLPEVLI